MCRGLIVLSDRWTSRGYRVPQDDGTEKVCNIGALAVAAEQIVPGIKRKNSHEAARLATEILNLIAEKHFHMSAVSVNAELGYSASIKLYAIAIEEAMKDATSINPNYKRLGH